MRTEPAVFVVALSIAFTATAMSRSVPRVAPSPVPVASSAPRPAGAPNFTLTVTGASDAEYHLLEAALVAGMGALHDPKCRSRILASSYAGKPGFANTTDTPDQVLARNDSAPWSVHIDLVSKRWYQRYSSATASTSGSVTTLYRDYVARADFQELANTEIHEYQHTDALGYVHDFWLTAARPFSEPYAVGDMVESCLRDQASAGSARR